MQSLGSSAGADEPFDTDCRRLAEADVEAEVGGQRRPDDFLLDLAVERDGDLLAGVVLPDVDQWVLLGELGERNVEGAAVAAMAGNDDRLQARRGELVLLGVPPRRADHVTDLDLRQTPQLPDLSGRHGLTPIGRALAEEVDRGHLPLAVPAEPHPVPGSDRPGEHADVGDLLARCAAFDLENTTRSRTVNVSAGRRQQFGNPAHQRIHTGTGARRTEEHWMHQHPSGLRREFLAEPPLRHPRLAVDVRGQDRVVLLGQQLGQPGREGIVGAVPGREVGGARSELTRGAHRDDRWCQSLRDGPEQAVVTRAATVDLVDEHEGRDAQSMQRAHQDVCLRLHAFDGRDHQYGTVEHAQGAFHLGDEIRVAGRVDQVDRDVLDRERHDGGLDRDPALLLQRQRVCLGRASIDATDRVDDTCGVEKPLGESCLTGVYMRQDPQVERFPRHASYPLNRS